jgi:thymidylate kinase/thymidylate synthase ThyX
MNQHETPRNGFFLVVEGTDGSGKSTQVQLLAKRMRAQGYDVAIFDFPRYEEPSSYFVKEYLNGEYGTADEVGPYTGSLFYALDRFEAAPAIREALQQGKIVLANRFTGSNMAHQGTKFHNAEERRGYFIWLDNLEFEMLHVPRPDMSFVLRVPAEIAQKLVDKKPDRSYTDKKRDIHEADLAHLRRSVEVYDDLCELFPKDFARVDCTRANDILSPESVHEILWNRIRPLLPDPENAKAAATAQASTISDNPYIVKKPGGVFEITKAGHNFLEESVTDPEGNVYAFGDKLSPTTIAAAMARLSRRGDDMRVTILDEFAHKLGKDQQLLQRVITAYGDDSVQQLAGLHFVVEGASMVLTKKLEWGRLAAYLEQSTRYIYFDQKDEKGKYRYLVPTGLSADVEERYRKSMDKIFDLYSEMVHRLTAYITTTSKTPMAERDGAWRMAVRAQACDATRAVLPLATKATVGIFASGQALESLIMHLLSDELPEARQTGEKLLKQARKVVPTFLERADKPDRGGATVAYRANTRKAMQKIAEKELAGAYTSGDNQPITLVDYWPRNELSLAADMLYEHSDLSLKQLQETVNAWPYDKKADVLKKYMGERLNRRHKPGRALEKAHYSWDLVSEWAVFKDLQRHRMVDDLEWQAFTPRYGFDVPQLIEDAGLTEEFETCFDISLQLHSLLQANAYPLEAQYATLQGHKMRWKITYNARQAFHFHELRTSPQGHPAYRKFVKQMHEKIAEVHPLIAEAMQFVNCGEDPELTRLAAERYTQFKIQQLENDKEQIVKNL